MLISRHLFIKKLFKIMFSCFCLKKQQKTGPGAGISIEKKASEGG